MGQREVPRSKLVILCILSWLCYLIYSLPAGLTAVSICLCTYFLVKSGLHEKRAFFYSYVFLIAALLVLTRTLGLPVSFGLSYYSLRAVSYVCDVRRGDCEKEDDPVILALYISLFTTLFLGPVCGIKTFKEGIEGERKDVSHHLLKIAEGLIKKLVISNALALYIDTLLGKKGIAVLISCLLYYPRLYTDFSGGYDMVMGISGCLGISLPENFDRPYLSTSVAEFWRRWHITLGEFLKKNVYIPLGGNRKHKKLNLAVTFIVSGLWHGTDYILWGVYNAFLSVLDIKIKKRAAAVMVTFLLVSLGWVFFLYPGFSEGILMLSTVFSDFSLSFLKEISCAKAAVVMLFLILMLIEEEKRDEICDRLACAQIWTKVLVLALLVMAALLFGTYGISFDHSSFIYSTF